jgi:hypothetical protein
MIIKTLTPHISAPAVTLGAVKAACARADSYAEADQGLDALKARNAADALTAQYISRFNRDRVA